jgi:uncharacterized protein (DUF305 family)
MTCRSCRSLALTLAVLAAASCQSARATVQGPPLVQPGAPGQPTRPIALERAVNLSQVSFTPADVAFMQGMIGHHAQALEMTGLLKTRSRDDDLRRLAERIEASQSDEIRMMEDWLTSHGHPLPDPHAHHRHGAHLMPGMLPAEQMTRLAEASGPAFDRLFLASMIAHHEGALVMVRDLLALPRAAQDSEIFGFVSDVEADQKMEIVRMAAMLNRLRESQQ